MRSEEGFTVQSTYLQGQLGSAVVTFTEPVVAGSLTAFDLLYTAGFFGVDDSGGLKIVYRFASDLGPTLYDYRSPQFTARIPGSQKRDLSYDLTFKQGINKKQDNVTLE